jgi:hypothetical protein
MKEGKRLMKAFLMPASDPEAIKANAGKRFRLFPLIQCDKCLSVRWKQAFKRKANACFHGQALHWIMRAHLNPLPYVL